MKLSESILNRRTDRLNEWQMDELSRDIKQLEQQNAKLIECFESLLDYGHTGEDAFDMQIEIKQTLSEVKGE